MATPLCLKVAGNLRPSPSSEIRHRARTLPAQPSLTEATFSPRRQPDRDTKDITRPGGTPEGRTPGLLLPLFPLLPKVRRFCFSRGSPGSGGREERDVLDASGGGNVQVTQAGVEGRSERFYRRRSDFACITGKVQILCSPNTRGSVRRRRGPRFHLCVGCGLLFGSVFIAAECGTRSG